MSEIDTSPNQPSSIPSMAPVTADHLITADEVRRLAGGISDMTLWRWLRRGILPEPLTIERRRYWWRGAVVAALNSAGRNKAVA